MTISDVDSHNTDSVDTLSLEHQAQNIMHATVMSLGKETSDEQRTF